MKTFIALLLLLPAAAHGAETHADGLYLSARGSPAPQIQGQDGTTLYLGEKQDLAMHDSRIVSVDNANASFLLDIGIPYDPALRANTYILMVAGTAYRQPGYGCSVPRSCSLNFRISQDANAIQVAGYLGIPISYFHHPGYRLQVSFIPARRAFARGEDVTATLRIINLGTAPIAFMNNFLDECPDIRGTLYIFSAFKDGKPVPDIGNRPDVPVCGITMGTIKTVLQPAAAFADTVSLSKWFAFREAGTYKVHGSYPLQFLEPDSRNPTSIWSDYAAADFTVTIE